MSIYIIDDLMEMLGNMREEVLNAAETSSMIQTVVVYIELHERIMSYLNEEYEELRKEIKKMYVTEYDSEEALGYIKMINQKLLDNNKDVSLSEEEAFKLKIFLERFIIE